MRRGYLVWIDKHKLLGGESFPSDIAVGITERSFRVLALMSKSSVNKRNPQKERVLAEKVSKKTGTADFLIPLTVDDISPDDFDFTTTDRSAIDFSVNWAKGLSALIKKLESLGCPKNESKAQEVLQKFALEGDLPISGPEKVVSNLIQILKLPKELYGYKVSKGKILGRGRVGCKRENIVWFLGALKEKGRSLKPNYTVKAESLEPSCGIVPRHILQNLLEKTLVRYCLKQGLKLDEEELYFPLGLLNKDKISYPHFSGRKTWSSVSGVVTGGYSNGEAVKFRYFLVPTFWLILDRFDVPVLRIGVRLRTTDLNQKAFPTKIAFRKRKRATNSWRNKAWNNKHCAIAYWLTKGRPLKFLSGSQTFEIGDSLILLDAENGIDEQKVGIPEIVDAF